MYHKYATLYLKKISGLCTFLDLGKCETIASHFHYQELVIQGIAFGTVEHYIRFSKNSKIVHSSHLVIENCLQP